MTGTLGPARVSTKLRRVAELARQAPEMVFTTLAHHVDLEFLQEAYRRIRKAGAVGVDGVTASQYEEDLWDNLRSLLERFKSGSYKAPPVRRVHIPKGDGKKTRPIGIPTLEDKILQRAVAMLLDAVYEQDFLECSFGFRRGRSAHDALNELRDCLMKTGGGWVIDLDIKSFFDEMDHSHLRSFLDQRVRDGVLRRTIDKWLKAGVFEAGFVRHPTSGSPQGGVISPVLSNVYLHEVLDKWIELMVKPVLRGRVSMVRYADDALIAFTTERDAQRVLNTLPKRLGKYGLSLNQDKTRLVRFYPSRKPGDRDDHRNGKGHGTFDFLGFTHYWTRSRRGYWVIKKGTAKGRLRRTIKRVSSWCREILHKSVYAQHKILVNKLRGHYAYFGVPGNRRAVDNVLLETQRIWRKWLSRRSQRGRVSWSKFYKLLRRYPLPRARINYPPARAARR
jgi:RNA-directed DNA polymerase